MHRPRHLSESACPARQPLRIAFGQRRERELPATAHGRHELGHDGEGRGQWLRCMLERPDELRHTVESSLGKRAQQLDLGARTSFEPAVQLQHELLIDDNRGIRLLDADGPHRLALCLHSRESGDPAHGGRVLERIAGFVSVEGQRQQVGLVRALGEPHLDEHELELGVGMRDGRDVRTFRVALLGGKPAAIGDEAEQLLRAERSARLTSAPRR